MQVPQFKAQRFSSTTVPMNTIAVRLILPSYLQKFVEKIELEMSCGCRIKTSDFLSLLSSPFIHFDVIGSVVKVIENLLKAVNGKSYIMASIAPTKPIETG